jgi:hypothetical protein
MVFGMSLATYTLLHVLMSLAGIGSGLVVLYGFLTGKRLDGWSIVFLVTTAATSLSGFGFPFERLLPSHILGILSLLALSAAIPARYVFHLAGAWRRTYVVASSVALYFNVFVLVAQLFLKVPALKALAPTGKEPPFLVAQVVVMAIFVALTIAAAERFHVEASEPPDSARRIAPG